MVTGPLAIRMIKPPPIEVDVHGPRHPATWHSESSSVDATTGKTNRAILECDIDLLSEKAIRRVINIVRPHLRSITIDCALVVSAPQWSDVEEPCCCLGLWRIDKVDFESCAVFPEKTIDEAADELKKFVASFSGGSLAEAMKSAAG